MVNVPPLKNATLPPVPKGVNVNGVLLPQPELSSNVVDQNTGVPRVFIEGVPSGLMRCETDQIVAHQVALQHA
jgi:hypothetical protein